MALNKLSMKGKDVGAAKGEAEEPDNDAPDLSMLDKQRKGPKDSPPKKNESASDGGGADEMRGMSSPEAQKHWKMKVPTGSMGDHYKGGKK